MDKDNSMEIQFSSTSYGEERSVCLTQRFEEGSPAWTRLVPLFKDFLSAMGYILPEESEFVLMPIEQSLSSFCRDANDDF